MSYFLVTQNPPKTVCDEIGYHWRHMRKLSRENPIKIDTLLEKFDIDPKGAILSRVQFQSSQSLTTNQCGPVWVAISQHLLLKTEMSQEWRMKELEAINEHSEGEIFPIQELH